MSRPLRIEFENAFYHVMSRGDRKDNIFEVPSYKDKFIEKMSETFYKYEIECFAYCIMNNHYHIFIKTRLPNLTKAMFYLNTSYANWYKAKTSKVGHVFQGRYKAILIDSDNYALSLANYIHLNPKRAGLVKKIGTYNFSSIKYYLNKTGSVVNNMNKELVMNFFKVNNNINSIEEKYLNHLKRVSNSDSFKERKVYKSIAIGEDPFIKKIENFIKIKNKNKEIPTTNMYKTKRYFTIFEYIEEEFDIDKDRLLLGKYNNIYRKMAIFLLKKYTRLKIKYIGNIFSIGYSTVCYNSKSFEKILDNDCALRERVRKIVRKLKT